MTPNISNLAAKIQKLNQSGKKNDYVIFLQNYHEADIADALEELEQDAQLTFFRNVNPERSVEVIEELEKTDQTQILSTLKTELAAKLVEKMEPDNAVNALEYLLEDHKAIAQKIMHALPQKEAQEIRDLLSYSNHSAGAIMTSNFVSMPENLSVAEALEAIRAQNPPDSEISYYIYVTNNNKQLVGITNLRTIIMNQPHKKIKEIRNNSPISTHYNTDQEEVANICQKYNLIAIPVIDDNAHLVGIVTIDDIVDVVVEEATEDIYKLSGTASENFEFELLSGSIFTAIRLRLPWLIITLVGGLIASWIINTYSLRFTESTFSLALSLSFVPLLMGLAGNIGNQSATIIVRGFATGHIKPHHIWNILFRELAIGCFIGSLLGLLLFGLNIWQTSPILSLIVSISVISNTIVATLLGAGLPAIFNKCKIDPAVASAPFISTSLDILGQLIYFCLTLGTIAYLAT